ncbi:branched-chain amino acid transport system ATP-binding protein [Neobacillus sp. B4I6]|jgi:branched-chain amino acid transport system ATP-binding protein|uniref:ABC transporter ATP-binding protein n=1 Tax=Neobacillus sp. B4I6 TaxID=3373925 RepID=UPI003D21695D
MSNLLEVHQIHSFYGKAQALHGLSIEVKKGEVVSLIGRNGVGKSTTLKSIMGLVNVEKGDIFVEGHRLNDTAPCEILSKYKISYVPEERRILSTLTVKENLLLGELSISKTDRKNRSWNLDRVYELFPILKEYQNKKGTHLSGGEQQMLAIGRGLMGDPKILLLDEPCEGLAPIIVQELTKAIEHLYHDGITIILVEQSLRLSKVLSHRQYILNKGEIVYLGKGSELFDNEELVQQYLSV